MALVFVDFENVKDEGLAGMSLLNEKDDLCIFYSDSCPKVSKKYIEEASGCGVPVEVRKLVEVRKNGLDFYIASQLGYAFARKQGDGVIVSRDTGFIALRDYWEKASPDKRRVHIAGTIEDGLLLIGDERSEKIRDGHDRVGVEEFLNIRTEEKMKDDLFAEKEEELFLILTESPKKCWNMCLKLFKRDDASRFYKMLKDKRDSKADDTNGGDLNNGEQEKIVSIARNRLLTVSEAKEKARLSGHYGSYLMKAVAQIIKSERSSTLTNIVNDTKGAEECNPYKGLFHNLKDADVKAEIFALSEAGAISFKCDKACIRDINLLNAFADPKPLNFRENARMSMYSDVDWHSYMQTVKDWSKVDWDSCSDILDHPYLLCVDFEEVTRFFSHAPTSLKNKWKKKTEEKQGFAKHWTNRLLTAM